MSSIIVPDKSLEVRTVLNKWLFAMVRPGVVIANISVQKDLTLELESDSLLKDLLIKAEKDNRNRVILISTQKRHDLLSAAYDLIATKNPAFPSQ